MNINPEHHDFYVDIEPPQIIKRAELIRLLCQSLRELGYPQISEELTRLSSYTCEATSIKSLRTNVIEGNWLAAVACLEDSSLDQQLSNDQIKQIKFILLRQFTLETIATTGDYMSALDVIRNKIQPLGVCQESLHALAGCLICETQNEMKSVVHWDGANIQGRQSTLRELQTFIPPDVMLPEGRLLTLIKQALNSQRNVSACYDNVDAEMSLFSDFRATVECLPTNCTQVLEGHSDQVWGAAFSPDGNWLASAGLDGKLGLWKVDTGTRKLVPPALFFHVASAAVLTIAWTPNSQQLIAACESDEGSSRSGQVCIKVCQVPEGSDGNEARILDLEIEAGPLRTFCCSADGKYLFRIDTEQNLAIERMPEEEAGVDQHVLKAFRPGKMLDIATSPNGRWLAITFGHMVKVYNVALVMSTSCLPDMSNALVATYTPQHSAMNVVFSKDSQYLLMDFKDRSLAVCYLRTTDTGAIGNSRAPSQDVTAKLTCEHTLRPSVPMAEEEGLKLRPSFGGRNGAFVCQGSEKGVGLLWHWPTQTSLPTLQGHRQAVNTVAWSPVDPHMVVTTSDDKTLRVWTSIKTSV